ncbi:MAG: SGNH/GDSL hydrolase family protein [Patescibacteria group bacterium]
MNIFGFLATVAFAAESVLTPLSDVVMKPAVSFADLMKTVSVVDEKGSVQGTGKFFATIVAGEAAVPDKRVTKESRYTIAFLGDSMIDTLGSDLALVQDELRRVYPLTAFTLLNYGVGGENIVSGLERVTRDTVYMGQHRPSLISEHPDVIVIESFGYNPFSFETGALQQHWLSLAYIVDAIKANLPDAKIVIAATIGPNSRTFGDGASGLSFSQVDKWQRTQTIKSYLENATRFAKSEQLPLADAYHPSLDSAGDGKELYVNPGDHIHYSDLGRQLFVRTVVHTIVNNKLLE